MFGVWRRDPRVDWLVAFVVVAGWLAFAWLFDARMPLDDTDSAARLTAYQLLGGLAATTVALFVVPLSVMLALAPTERLALVLGQHRSEIRSAVIAAASTAVALAAWAVLAAISDSGDVAAPAGWFQLVGIALGVTTILAAARIVSVLSAMLRIGEALPLARTADDIEEIGSRR